jgi:hypothetical protein
MAYPKELNKKYKAEKAAGTTTAKSFNEWNALKAAEPTLDEALTIAFAALETVDKALDVAKVNKAARAEAIFVEAKNKDALIRKEVLASFQKAIEDGGAGLTIAGSNTYFHNLKEKYGLIVHKS